MVKIPKYRPRKDRGYAFVEWKGARKKLPGAVDSVESLEAYHAFVREVLKQARAEGKIKKAPPPRIPGTLSVTELVAAYLDHAIVYYAHDGRKGGEYDLVHLASRPLVRKHGATRVVDFGPLALKEVRQSMIDEDWRKGKEKGVSWSRRFINSQVGRIRRIFKWGVEEQLVPATIHEALRAVAPLKRGRTEARERPKVKPVPLRHVHAILPYLTPVVAAMVTLQELTGMRSENLWGMQPRDIDQSADVWLYVPGQHVADFGTHKSAWRDKDLVIPLGPKCQEILRPFLEGRAPDAFCFSPAESEEMRREARRSKRKSKVQPSQEDRRTANPKRAKRDHYDSRTYRRALLYGIHAANRKIAETNAENEKLPEGRRKQPVPPIPRWHPHQLRHTVATAIRKRFKAEGARVYLGHARLNVTEIYAEADLDLARQIAREMG
jgi:integrase